MEVGVAIIIALVVVVDCETRKDLFEPDLFDEGHVAKQTEQGEIRGGHWSRRELFDAQARALEYQCCSIEVQPRLELRALWSRQQWRGATRLVNLDHVRTDRKSVV